MRSIPFALVLILIAGCGNESITTSVRLGDVSLGQQLIDLKRALEEDAISPEEYQRARQSLLELAEIHRREQG